MKFSELFKGISSSSKSLTVFIDFDIFNTSFPSSESESLFFLSSLSIFLFLFINKLSLILPPKMFSLIPFSLVILISLEILFVLIIVFISLVLILFLF